MNVLVADRFEESGLDGLRHVGDVVYQPELTGDALRDAIVATASRSPPGGTVLVWPAMRS